MNKTVCVLIVLIVLFNVWVHAFVSGWAPYRPDREEPTSAVYGVVFNPTDTLSYSAWAQQAKQGVYPFGNLYTTTEHDRLLISPFFFAIGTVAGIFSTSPLAVLNVLGLTSIPVFSLGLLGICRRLKFDGVTTTLVFCLTMGGGGISWIRFLLDLLGLASGLRISETAGPDLFYFDLYPITTLVACPYHAVSLAVLAVIGWAVIGSEDLDRRFSPRDILLLIVSSTCLASMRPYEPTTLLVAYGTVVVASYTLRLSRATCRRRLVVFGCLACGLLPLTAHSVWVSRQPVWDHFASMSFEIQGARDWTSAFFFLWVLALAGVFFNLSRKRLVAGRTAFFVAWSALVFFLLVVLHSGFTKLCGGCTLPLGVLAGMGLRYFKRRVRHDVFRPLVPLLVFAAFASPAFAFFRFATMPVSTDVDLFQAAQAIRRLEDRAIPTVLTDPGTAEQLPGLAGFRVYCGHWALTDDYKAKSMLLAAMGLPSETAKPFAAESADFTRLVDELDEQLAKEQFQYLFARTDGPLLQSLDNVHTSPPPVHLVYSGDRYVVLKMDRDIIHSIRARLQTVGSSNREPAE